MCSTPKMPAVQPVQTEIIKEAVQANASVQKANAQNRTGIKGLVSENIRTSNTGIDEEIGSSKKKLLGE